jgi:hypothetical protein
MKAEKALKHSQDKLIVADASQGLVIIQQECSPERVLLKSFQVRFVLRHAHERDDGSGIMTVGSYDDLDTAVTIAAVKYGISSEQWLPASRYAVATLGTALLQNTAIDASLLLKRGPEQGE